MRSRRSTSAASTCVVIFTHRFVTRSSLMADDRFLITIASSVSKNAVASKEMLPCGMSCVKTHWVNNGNSNPAAVAIVSMPTHCAISAGIIPRRIKRRNCLPVSGPSGSGRYSILASPAKRPSSPGRSLSAGRPGI